TAQRISELFGRAFWHSDDPAKQWPAKGIMRRLPKMPLVILAFDEAREAIGYSMFNTVSWKDQLVLFADSAAVSGGSPNFPQNWQNCGLGTEMLREALRQIPAEIVAARTQNAVIVRMIRGLHIGRPERNGRKIEILPLDADYTEDDIDLLRAIKNQIPEFAGEELDFATGISKRIYQEGKLGD